MDNVNGGTATAVVAGANGAQNNGTAKNMPMGAANAKPPVNGAPPKVDPKAPPVVDANAGKEKFVVNGKEIWLTPEQSRAYVQKGIAFEPRISELARLQNETAAFLQTLKTEPEKILFDKRIGHTPEGVLEKILSSSKISDEIKERVGKWYYDKVYTVEKMDPKDRAIMERDQKLSEFEAEKKRAADEAVRSENQTRVNMALNQVKSQIHEAMKDSGLPSNDTPLGALMARNVADIMRLAYFERKSVTPKQAIEKVKSQLKYVQTAFYESLTPEQLVQELGEANAEKVRKYYLKVVNEANKKPPVDNGGSRPSRSGERKTITPDDMKEYLEERKRNG